MKYIIAVSGGVDSVVLLDMMTKHRDKNQLIVAHFDHGIRQESAADARFVEALASSYGLPFKTKREELGESASENLARDRRYAFLGALAKKHDAIIVTAHHQDDVIETVAINLIRGTGWRGLAVLSDEAKRRPLLSKRKSELYTYALTHQLEWIEDETNQSTRYLRNQIRHRLGGVTDQARQRLIALRSEQLLLTKLIKTEVRRRNATRARYNIIMWPEPVALEVLRAQTNGRLTRPQLRSLYMAIKTARAGAKIEAGSGVTVTLGQRDFTFESSS